MEQCKDIFQRAGARIKVLPVQDEQVLSTVAFVASGAFGDNQLEWDFFPGNFYAVTGPAEAQNMYDDLTAIQGVIATNNTGAPNATGDDWEVIILFDAQSYVPGIQADSQISYTYQIGGFTFSYDPQSVTYASTGRKFIENQRPFHMIVGTQLYGLNYSESNPELREPTARLHRIAGYFFAVVGSSNPEIYCCDNNTTAPDINRLCLLHESTRHEGKCFISFRELIDTDRISQIAIIEYNSSKI